MAIQCPQIPAKLANGLPPPGSAEWCAWIDDAIAFFTQLGTQVAKWLDANMDNRRWRNAVNDYRNTLIAAANAPSLSTWIRILGWFIDIIDIVNNGLDVVKDLWRCVFQLRTLVTPVAQPEAYLGVQLIDNVLKSIKTLKLGSQSYLGFTVDAIIDLPAVEQLVDHLLLYLAPLEMPGAAEATQAWARGLITVDQRNCVWKYWGHNPRGYEPYVLGQTQAMGVEQAIQWGRRHAIDGDGLISLIRRAGVVDTVQQQGILDLFDRLPTQAEALTWTRRHANDDAFAAKYGTDNGFDNQYWPAYQEALTSQGVTQDVARQNYRQNWTTPSRGELLEFLYRLRPDNPNVTASFTDADYRAMLSASGYSPTSINWLTQIAHRQLGVGEARELYYRGLLDQTSLKAAFYATGLGDFAVGAISDQEVIARNQWRARTYGGWTPQAAGKSYAIGLINRQQLAQIVVPLGASNQDVAALADRSLNDYQYRILQRANSRLLFSAVTSVRQSLRVGVLDITSATNALASVGWPATQAAGIAGMVAADARTALVKQAIGHLRSALLAGEITTAYTESALSKLGVVPSAISQYISLWNIQNTPSRKRRSASQIVNDLAEGTLAIEDATSRLQNLGYEAADIALYMEDARRKQITTAPARAEAKALQQSKQIAKRTYLPGLSKRAIIELKAQETPTMLATYLKGGFISPQYTEMRLQLYGWDEQPIADFLAANTPAAKTNTANGTPAQGTAGSNGTQSGGSAGQQP